jgi:trans-aconitate methyltransferase
MTEKFYHTKESVKQYIQMAKDVNGRELIEKMEQFLAHDSKLLEIGSGPGTDWNILKTKYDVTGSDYSKEFIKHLKSENPHGEFLELDACTLKTKLKFDGIYSNKVLHHLTDQELLNSIQRQHEILIPQGIICHSFWNGEGSEDFKEMFVNYHNETELRTIFDKNFEIQLLEPYKEFEKNDSILLIARKH